MSKKKQSAKLFNELHDAFKCPLCDGALKVVNLQSVVCHHNHTFDFARQGYINFMTRPTSSHYSKELFLARKKIITESNLYEPLHETIANSVQKYAALSPSPLIADLGCGEGSHLEKIIHACANPAIRGVGLDIAKEGILSAARTYINPIWVVGDLANSPLADESFGVIFNILSPANYDEFNRILQKNGLVIKVVPRANYLKELREAIFTNGERNDYDNKDTVSLFKQHFNVVDKINLNYTKNLKRFELKNLVSMTPLTWSANQAQIDAFLNQDVADITVNLDVLIGRKFPA